MAKKLINKEKVILSKTNSKNDDLNLSISIIENLKRISKIDSNEEICKLLSISEEKFEKILSGDEELMIDDLQKMISHFKVRPDDIIKF